MPNRIPRRRSYRRSERAIRIESDRNPDLPTRTAKVFIDAAALERARLEAEAQADREAGEEADHA